MHSTLDEEENKGQEQPRPRDVIADVYALRRKIALGVYAVITFDLPIYYFTGYTWMQIALLAVVGWVVAGSAIFVTFRQIIKLRKRTSYPELLLVKLGDTATAREAADEALFILEGLLEADVAFIAMTSGSEQTIAAARGVLPEEAKWVMETHARQLDAAVTSRYPHEVAGERSLRAAFVPIAALKRTIGVLYVSSSKGEALTDLSLLNDIGGALGLSLENLRQKEQLLQKESRLRSVITGAPVVLFAVNTDGVIVFNEGQAMEAVGISPDTIIGRPVADVYAAYPEILQSFRRAFAGDEVLSTATIEANGNRIIFEYRLAPEKDENGRVTGVIGVATDVTQRKLAESALSESERFLSTLVGNLPGFVMRLEGAPLTIKYVSEGVEVITGFSAVDLIGKPFSFIGERLHPDDRDRLRDLVVAIREGGGAFESEFRFSHKSGEERWLWEQGEVIVDDDGGAAAIEVFSMDVTGRKRAADALAENERFLSTLVGNLPGFVMRCATEDPRAITYISGGVKDLLGIEAADLVGKPVSFLGEMMDDEDRLALIRRILFAARTGRSFEAEFRVRDVKGNDKTLLHQGQIVTNAEGQPIALESFTMDVTERKLAADALRRSERFLSTLVSNLPGFVLRADITDTPTITYVSDGVRDVIGFEPVDLIGQHVDILATRMDDDQRWLVAEAIGEAVKSSGGFEIEFRVHHPDTGERWLWEQGQVVRDEASGVTSVEGFVMDVTERKRAEQALEASEQRFRDIYENANDAMVTFDFRGRFHSVNRRMLELFGYTREEFMQLNPADLTPPETQVRNAGYLQRVFQGDSAPFEVELLAKDGRLVPLEMTARIATDATGRARTVQMIGRDISERRQAEETIRRLAYHDALTGLPNRALFEDRLRMALAQARRQREMVGVLFLDLDGFKVVNDTLGHNAGDKLLRAVAGDLQMLVRDGDTVARVGGDEFTLLLPGIESVDDLIDVAQRILESLRQPRTISGHEFRTTASVGITAFPADGRDGETLLRNADTAMYRAKEHGRDNYQLYTAAMNLRMMERLSFEQSLRHAITRSELSVFYQPIVETATGRVTAAEALVRWFHPTRGIVLPDEFIPLAEETGLILDIGESVLVQVCNQIVDWQRQGLEINRVAVNLSARQLQQEDLVARIARILRDAGVAPAMIQLEITEGAVLKNVEHAIAMLNQLRQMGISIALDDFGTGYSSLTYLKRFPVDAVKIDRTFVRDLEHDASDATIVSTVIAMADNLGLKVIAEGVETAHQLAFLRARGCTEFQGYLFSKPVPPERLAELITGGRSNGNGTSGVAPQGTEPLTAA